MSKKRELSMYQMKINESVELKDGRKLTVQAIDPESYGHLVIVEETKDGKTKTHNVMVVNSDMIFMRGSLFLVCESPEDILLDKTNFTISKNEKYKK